MDVVLGCLGISKDDGLSQDAIDRLADMAEEVHHRARWSAPCCPADLALSEGVAVVPGPFLALLPDWACYQQTGDKREDGLAMAIALASVLLVRRRRYTDLRACAFAAELLIPEWSLDVDHQWAPSWLLRVRARVLRA